ncbi:MAG: FtsX-like permease family protein [Candidatus Handelsmanbacteria bacterium]|nr:FtsX-like permease family protein [Candidatus Handelsmanbacteria bacterium]
MNEQRLQVAGGREIVLPMSKAVEISIRSLKIRFGRSLITTSGIILAIAFLMSVWSSNALIGSLKEANKSEINLLLQKNGIETASAEGGRSSADARAQAQEERSKQTWLIGLSLLVCVVGIANAMLMSVTERFREIGTMKCLGALDSFIIKLFLLESTFQGVVGTTIGIAIGLLMTLGLNLLAYGGYVFSYFPVGGILQSVLASLVAGTLLSLVGAMLPAYKAAKMEPVEAMRSDT